MTKAKAKQPAATRQPASKLAASQSVKKAGGLEGIAGCRLIRLANESIRRSRRFQASSRARSAAIDRWLHDRSHR